MNKTTTTTTTAAQWETTAVTRISYDVEKSPITVADWQRMLVDPYDYVIKCYDINGAHQRHGDYFTDDHEDALATSAEIIRRSCVAQNLVDDREYMVDDYDQGHRRICHVGSIFADGRKVQPSVLGGFTDITVDQIGVGTANKIRDRVCEYYGGTSLQIESIKVTIVDYIVTLIIGCRVIAHWDADRVGDYYMTMLRPGSEEWLIDDVT
jgi:hypothetical protein